MQGECIFCQIAQGQSPCHLINQDEWNMAFLDIFPNTVGATVVIPKAHYPSDYSKLNKFARASIGEFLAEVMKQLTNFFDDVGRCGVVMEGYGINHFHYKVYPLHGTPKESPSGDGWTQILSPPEMHVMHERYRGYVTSASGPKADSEQLAKLAKQLYKDWCEKP